MYKPAFYQILEIFSIYHSEAPLKLYAQVCPQTIVISHFIVSLTIKWHVKVIQFIIINILGF